MNIKHKKLIRKLNHKLALHNQRKIHKIWPEQQHGGNPRTCDSGSAFDS
jgi:hypothetical protein